MIQFSPGRPTRVRCGDLSPLDPREYDVCVIGGGIIGLATLMQLTWRFPGKRVVLLEKEPRIALHQTGHNSGVIHAGIYYAPGSQKANFCAAGGKLLREFCDRRQIEYRMCGKVIVATDDSQLPILDELYRRGTANGAEGLQMIGRERLRELEPHAAGERAIFSPNTGVIDYADVSRAYAAEAVENGAELVTGARVDAIVRRGGRLHVETTEGDVSAKRIVNCAGLHADGIARMMGVKLDLSIIPFRGEYFSIRPERSHLVRRLIYPVPNPNLPFLGVHFTRRIDGSVEAGPNAVLAFAREGYRKRDVNLSETLGALTFPGFWRMAKDNWKTALRENVRSIFKASFVRSLQALVPEVRSEDLHRPGGGVRAQAVDRRGRLLQDFRIVQTRDSVHVLNAPSPGATSSLTVGRYIVDMAQEALSLA